MVQLRGFTLIHLRGNSICLCHIYFGVNGTNFTYELTSKQNMAQIYVGTVEHCPGAVTMDFQFI